MGLWITVWSFLRGSRVFHPAKITMWDWSIGSLFFFGINPTMSSVDTGQPMLFFVRESVNVVVESRYIGPYFVKVAEWNPYRNINWGKFELYRTPPYFLNSWKSAQLLRKPDELETINGEKLLVGDTLDKNLSGLIATFSTRCLEPTKIIESSRR